MLSRTPFNGSAAAAPVLRPGDVVGFSLKLLSVKTAEQSDDPYGDSIVKSLPSVRGGVKDVCARALCVGAWMPALHTQGHETRAHSLPRVASSLHHGTVCSGCCPR